MALFGGRHRDDASRGESADAAPARRPSPAGAAHLGASLSFEGTLRGDEDVVVDGNLQGRIELPGGTLTVGPKGLVRAEISARRVVVCGRLEGNVVAAECVAIERSGVLVGDVTAPRLVVAEGGILNGTIAMESEAPAATSR